MFLSFDGGYSRLASKGTSGFSVLDPEGNEIVAVGMYDTGHTNNQCELAGLSEGLKFVV